MVSITLQVLINGLLVGGIYSLITIGLTLIFGVVRIINFAHGEFLMIGMYLSFWAFNLLGIDPYFSFLIIVPIGFVLGILTKKVVIKPLLKAPSNALVFATFGLSLVLQNGALLLWKSDPRAIQTSYSNAVLLLGDLVVSVPRLVVFIVTVVIVIGLNIFLQRTYLGKALTCVAQDKEAATLMGVNIDQIYGITIGTGVGLVTLAGVLLMPMYAAVPTIGLPFCIIAFVVTVLGGMGNVFGAFLAGLLIGLVEAFSGFFINPQIQGAAYYLIFIAVLILRPQGLLGKVGAQEMGLK